MKTLFYMGVLSICAFCAPAKADFTLFDGGSSFNFDTDTTGDWSLTPNPAVGGIDVLADFDFVIRTNYNSQETFFNFDGSLGSTMTINTVNLTESRVNHSCCVHVYSPQIKYITVKNR